MLTGERRTGSTRRGMTVLGKIPAVPKPINLPSQRLENRGLDPNVEIVPRGTLGWGSTGRSPPTGGSPWGIAGQSSSPPVSTGAWGGTAKAQTGSGSGISSGGWAGNPSRPSSAGSGTRPSSAGSIGQTQDPSGSVNAWGPPTSRPSSASGVSGQAQSQHVVMRPRSAETRPGSSHLSRFADSANEPGAVSVQAWGASGNSGKLMQSEEPLQPARFTLTPVDFPTLGSEKNPDLRPQQNAASSGRPASADGRIFLEKERRPLTSPPSPCEEIPAAHLGPYGGQERGMPDTWRRDGLAFTGPPPPDGHWHRDGPHMPPFVGAPPSESWRREAGHGAPSVASPADDTWRRGGPPVGPYGPPGPGRFPHDTPSFMSPRFGPAGVGYRRGGPGLGGYGRHGDMYGNSVTFMRPGVVAPPGRPGLPMGPSMYPGSLQYDGYYGSPGTPQYGNMDDREMLMLGMVGGPGIYGSYPHPGAPEHFGRPGHSTPGAGPRPPGMHAVSSREQTDFMSYEGDAYHEAGNKDVGKHRDGWNPKDSGNPRDGVRSGAIRDAGDNGAAIPVSAANIGSDAQKHTNRTTFGRHQPGHRDWGAASSGDEPMDFSKPVFEEEVSSATSGSEGFKHSDTLLKDKMPRGQLSSNVLLSHQSSKGHVLNKKNKPVEENRGSGGGSTGEPLNLAASGMADQVKSESPKVKKERENFRDRETPREVHEGHNASEHLEMKYRTSVENVQITCAGKESNRALKSATENKEEVLSSSANTCNNGVLLSKVVSDASTSKNLSQSSGKAMVYGSASSLPPASCAGSVSVVETSTSTREKFTSVVSPRGRPNRFASDSEAHKKSDKLKESGDACSDSLNNNVEAVDQVVTVESSKNTATIQEPNFKDDHRPRSRLNNHEGEKEWRPKLPAVESRTQASKPTGNSGAQARKVHVVPMSTSASEVRSSPEKGSSEPENSQLIDSYDYEAQRAKLKEIANQRARQLQKEEEERTKEQKAKAFAKLEELNRRTSATLNTAEATISEESTEMTLKVQPPVQQQSSSESGIQLDTQAVDVTEVPPGSLEGIGRVVKHEHGKRDWDHKRSLGNKEELRSKANIGEHKDFQRDRGNGPHSAPKAEPPLLPSPPPQLSSSQALLPAPVASQTSQQQIAISQTIPQTQQQPLGRSHVRQRNKLYSSQPKRQSHGQDEEAPSSAPLVVGFEVTQEMCGGNDSRHQEPVSTFSVAKEAAGNIGSSSGTSEGVASFRKKKNNRSGKNKHRLDGPTMTIDSSGTAEQASVVSDWSSGDMSGDGNHVKDAVRGTTGGEPAALGVTPDVASISAQVSKHDFTTPELGKDIAFGSFQEGDYADLGMTRQNDDGSNKMAQQKSQSLRRSFRDRGLQDARMTDKQHANEGMVWAPVRSLSTVVVAGSESSNRLEGNAENLQEIQEQREKSEEVSSQNSLRSRRAEIERYNPKSGGKKQMQQQVTAGAHQAQRQLHANETSWPEDKAVYSLGADMQQSIEVKFGIENRPSESMRSGRSHTSWKQRNSSDNGVAKEACHNEATERGGNQLVPAFQMETEPKRKQSDLQHSNNNGSFSEQPTSHRVRNVGTQPTRTVSGQTSRQRNQLSELERDQQPPLQSSRLQSQGTALSAEELPPQGTQRDILNRQDNLSVYQPVRSVRHKSFRPHSRHGQFEAEPHGSIENLQSEHVVSVQSGKHDSLAGSYEREKRSFQEREVNRRPRSAGSNNPRQQGSVDDRDHFSSNAAGSQFYHKSGPGGLSKTVQGANYREKEHQSNHTQQLTNQPHRAQVHGHQNLGGKEPSPHDNSVKVQQSISPRKQQVKPQMLPLDEGLTGQAMTVPQEQTKTSQMNRQLGFERDHPKDIGNPASHQQRKHGPGQLQWQQAASVSVEKSGPTVEASGPLQSRKQHASSLKNTESVQPAAHQNSRPALNKMHPSVSAENQKNNSQFHYQPVSQPAQAFKQREQQSAAFLASEMRPEGVHNNTQQMSDRGDSSFTKGRDHGPSRRGRFNGRSRGAEIDSRRDQLPKQRLVIDATGGAVPSPVVG